MLNINFIKKTTSIPTSASYLTNIVSDNATFLLPKDSNQYSMNTLKHHSPSTKEWSNSVYSYHKNNYIKLLPAIDKSIYRLLNAYFNVNPSKKSKIIRNRFQKLSMIRLFISKPEIKHCNNKVIITIYTYNRKKLYFLNKIKKIFHISKYKNNNLNITTNFNEKLSSKNTFAIKSNLGIPLSILGKNNIQSTNHQNLNKIKIIRMFFNLKNKISKKNLAISNISTSNKNTKLNRYSVKLLKKNLKKKTNSLVNIIINKSTFTLYMFLYKSSYLKTQIKSTTNLDDVIRGFDNKDILLLNYVSKKLEKLYFKLLSIDTYKLKTLNLKLSKSWKYIILLFKKHKGKYTLYLKNTFSINRFKIHKENKLKIILYKNLKKCYLKERMFIENKIKKIIKSQKNRFQSIISSKMSSAIIIKYNNIFMSDLTKIKAIYTKNLFDIKKEYIVKLKLIDSMLYIDLFSLHENIFNINVFKHKFKHLSLSYYKFLLQKCCSNFSLLTKNKLRTYLNLFSNNMWNDYDNIVTKTNGLNKVSMTKMIPVNKMYYNKQNLNMKNLFNLKYFSSMLYFNNYIFNTNNLLALKDIVKKIYNKKVEFNIINLKYLYLDSNIFAEAITRKLIDRKKRVLRVLKLSLKLTKQPYFKLHFHRDNVQLNYMFLDRALSEPTKSLSVSIDSDNSLKVAAPIIKNKYIFKPKAYTLRLFLYHMKQKIINGIRLQGTGRLTKRLTASRSVSKLRYTGSLKNINSSYEGISTIMLRGFVKSNLQYANVNNHNRNGSFGTKVSISVY